MENNALMTKKVSYEVNGETIDLSGNTVKNYLVSGNGNVTDQEVVLFLNLCKFQKLNPFLNEAYLVKFGNLPAQIIVSKEAFMKRAEQNEQFLGFKAGIIVARDNEIVEIEGAFKLPNDILIGGFAEVYRKDRKQPVTVKISFDEFVKLKNGEPASTWKQMPMNMIRKTAIVNALREAFPNSLGAMYTEEEAQTEAFTQQPKSVAQNVQEHQATQTLDFKTARELQQENPTLVHGKVDTSQARFENLATEEAQFIELPKERYTEADLTPLNNVADEQKYKTVNEVPAPENDVPEDLFSMDSEPF